MGVTAVTLEATLESFLLAFVSASAVAAVAALIALLRYMRRMDHAVHTMANRQGKVVRWATIVGRMLKIPFPLEDESRLKGRDAEEEIQGHNDGGDP